MKDLIEALEIFLEYCHGSEYPTHCEHDVLYVPCVDPDDVPEVHMMRLSELGFFVDDDGCFASYKFGSC